MSSAASILSVTLLGMVSHDEGLAEVSVVGNVGKICLWEDFDGTNGV